MSLPLEFKERMESLIPDEAESFLSAMSTPPSVSVKLNRRKTSDDESWTDILADGTLADGNVAWCPSGLYLSDRPLFTLNPLLHAGVFYVQDASSMIYEYITSLLIDALGTEDHINVLDLCAAPGGKTTSIINALPDTATIVANEYVPQRAAILRENLAKWGFPNIITTNSDSAAFAEAGELFDIIAVDAPCSGEGMMRKEPKAVEQWSDGLTRQCRALQEEITANAANALKDGGYLIYSTCTFNRLENEEMARYITDTLGLVPFDPEFPEEWGIHHGIDTDIPCYRFMPHVTRGEGLFVCVFRKEVSTETSAHIHSHNSPPNKKKGKEKNGELPDLTGWLRTDCRPFRIKDTIYLRPPQVERLRTQLERYVRIMSAGVAAADLKGKVWAPRTELALCTNLDNDKFITSETDPGTALAYLRSESICLPSDTPTGYVLLTYHGHPLGFVKNIGNRANNLYPTEWRIRLTPARQETT